MKSKGVTTQMKALDEYFLMEVFMLLLNKFYVFANFMFNLNRETLKPKGLIHNKKHPLYPISLGQKCTSDKNVNNEILEECQQGMFKSVSTEDCLSYPCILYSCLYNVGFPEFFKELMGVLLVSDTDSAQDDLICGQPVQEL